VFVAAVNTLILVTSSFTMHWATQSVKRNNRPALRRDGADVPARPHLPPEQVIEYHRIASTQRTSRFGGHVLRLTGLHAATWRSA